jgi:hypothetical protein
MDRIRGARVPVNSLADLTHFLSACEQLKSLMLWREELRARDSGLMRSLERQIGNIKAQCALLASDNRYISELWRNTQLELSTLEGGISTDVEDTPHAS